MPTWLDILKDASAVEDVETKPIPPKKFRELLTQQTRRMYAHYKKPPHPDLQVERHIKWLRRVWDEGGRLIIIGSQAEALAKDSPLPESDLDYKFGPRGNNVNVWESLGIPDLIEKHSDEIKITSQPQRLTFTVRDESNPAERNGEPLVGLSFLARKDAKGKLTIRSIKITPIPGGSIKKPDYYPHQWMAREAFIEVGVPQNLEGNYIPQGLSPLEGLLCSSQDWIVILGFDEEGQMRPKAVNLKQLRETFGSQLSPSPYFEIMNTARYVYNGKIPEKISSGAISTAKEAGIDALVDQHLEMTGLLARSMNRNGIWKTLEGWMESGILNYFPELSEFSGFSDKGKEREVFPENGGWTDFIQQLLNHLNKQEQALPAILTLMKNYFSLPDQPGSASPEIINWLKENLGDNTVEQLYFWQEVNRPLDLDKTDQANLDQLLGYVQNVPERERIKRAAKFYASVERSPGVTVLKRETAPFFSTISQALGYMDLIQEKGFGFVIPMAITPVRETQNRVY